MEKKSLDDLFRSTENLDETPAPELWRRLEKRLDDQRTARRKRRRIRFLQLGTVGLVLFLLLLAAFFGWYFIRHGH